MQRSGSTSEDGYLRVNTDFRNHGHPDELAVQVYAHDRLPLPAVGAYADDPTANWLRKATESLSSVTIDGRTQDPNAKGALSQTMTGTVSVRLVDQLVTMGLSTVAVSGSLSSAGLGSPSVVAMMTFSNSTPPFSLVVLGLMPV